MQSMDPRPRSATPAAASTLSCSSSTVYPTIATTLTSVRLDPPSSTSHVCVPATTTYSRRNEHAKDGHSSVSTRLLPTHPTQDTGKPPSPPALDSGPATGAERPTKSQNIIGNMRERASSIDTLVDYPDDGLSMSWDESQQREERDKQQLAWQRNDAMVLSSEFAPSIDEDEDDFCFSDSAPFEATKLSDGLFLGDECAAMDADFLEQNEITGVVRCCTSREVPRAFSKCGLEYLSLGIKDGPEYLQRITPDEWIRLSDAVCRFVKMFVNRGDSVLIHSLRGMHRSSAVAIAYLMRCYHWSFSKALQFLEVKIPWVSAQLPVELDPSLRAFSEVLERQTGTFLSTDWELSSPSTSGSADYSVGSAYDALLMRNTFLNSLAPAALRVTLQPPEKRKSSHSKHKKRNRSMPGNLKVTFASPMASTISSTRLSQLSVDSSSDGMSLGSAIVGSNNEPRPTITSVHHAHLLQSASSTPPEDSPRSWQQSTESITDGTSRAVTRVADQSVPLQSSSEPAHSDRRRVNYCTDKERCQRARPDLERQQPENGRNHAGVVVSEGQLETSRRQDGSAREQRSRNSGNDEVIVHDRPFAQEPAKYQLVVERGACRQSEDPRCRVPSKASRRVKGAMYDQRETQPMRIRSDSELPEHRGDSTKCLPQIPLNNSLSKSIAVGKDRREAYGVAMSSADRRSGSTSLDKTYLIQDSGYQEESRRTKENSTTSSSPDRNHRHPASYHRKSSEDGFQRKEASRKGDQKDDDATSLTRKTEDQLIPVRETSENPTAHQATMPALLSNQRSSVPPTGKPIYPVHPVTKSMDKIDNSGIFRSQSTPVCLPHQSATSEEAEIRKSLSVSDVPTTNTSCRVIRSSDSFFKTWGSEQLSDVVVPRINQISARGCSQVSSDETSSPRREDPERQRKTLSQMIMVGRVNAGGLLVQEIVPQDVTARQQSHLYAPLGSIQEPSRVLGDDTAKNDDSRPNAASPPWSNQRVLKVCSFESSVRDPRATPDARSGKQSKNRTKNSSSKTSTSTKQKKKTAAVDDSKHEHHLKTSTSAAQSSTGVHSAPNGFLRDKSMTSGASSLPAPLATIPMHRHHHHHLLSNPNKSGKPISSVVQSRSQQVPTLVNMLPHQGCFPHLSAPPFQASTVIPTAPMYASPLQKHGDVHLTNRYDVIKRNCVLR